MESPFASDAVARAEKDRRLEGWKTAPRDDYKGIIPSNMLWGGRKGAGDSPPPRFRHAVRGRDADSLYYMIDLHGSSGLFHYRISERKETRLFHHAQFRSHGMAFDPDREVLVISSENRDGTAYLAVYDKEGNSKGTITGGDAMDTAPSCSMRDKGVVWFQSAGIARDRQSGHAVALGPSVVNRLSYSEGKLDTVLEDRAFDFLAPREDGRGVLYYIRRPYERSGVEAAGSIAKDAFMFPYRMLKAIFGYLNFFSTIYGREPLRSAGGPAHDPLERDLGALWLHGRMIQAANVSREESRGLVPASWQLRRRDRTGEDALVAEHVVSFDLCEDGSLFYSNGFEVFHILRDNPTSRKHDGIIEAVSAA
ncbi:MAG TPA: hypothetical protein VLT60_01010 [Usitatibacter sp.]|nr:hypothetical protein [Usitatibacter sp.]